MRWSRWSVRLVPAGPGRSGAVRGGQVRSGAVRAARPSWMNRRSSKSADAPTIRIENTRVIRTIASRRPGPGSFGYTPLADGPRIASAIVARRDGGLSSMAEQRFVEPPVEGSSPSGRPNPPLGHRIGRCTARPSQPILPKPAETVGRSDHAQPPPARCAGPRQSPRHRVRCRPARHRRLLRGQRRHDDGSPGRPSSEPTGCTAASR